MTVTTVRRSGAGKPGGGAWMNAGAYGGDFAHVLERALVATADGTGWLAPVRVARSRGYNRRQLARIEAIVQSRGHEFEEQWHEFFG